MCKYEIIVIKNNTIYLHDITLNKIIKLNYSDDIYYISEKYKCELLFDYKDNAKRYKHDKQDKSIAFVGNKYVFISIYGGIEIIDINILENVDYTDYNLKHIAHV